MSIAEETLRSYLSLPEPFPMAWDGRCDAVVDAASGKTVAFRAEIEVALGSLFREDLVPPFEAVVVGFQLIRKMASAGGTLGGVDSTLWHQPMATAHVVTYLLEMGSSPKDGPRARALLDGLSRGLPREGLSSPLSAELTRERLVSAQRIVDNGLVDADPNEILRRIRTGVEGEIAAAPVGLPVAATRGTAAEGAESIRQLLQELELNDDHGALARLAQRLMAPLRLPRPAALREELPIGGYADIANRGEIDRLLLSELAQDDDVLASRIVLGEALFLRREVPKDVPRQDLTMVVDAGIRTWGITRVFAVAGALAVAASADKGARVTAYRANGEALEPMDLTTRDGIEEHMGRLYADPHPGPAISQASIDGEAGSAGSRRVLVTTRTSFRAAELRDALAACGVDWTIVAVDSEGHVELFEHSRRGVRLAGSALVSLDDLSASSGRAKLSELWRDHPELPDYVHDWPAPLRIGYEIDRCMAVAHPEGLIVITARRQLVFWGKESGETPAGMRRGAREIGLIPRGTILAFGGYPGGGIVAVYDGNKRTLFWAEFGFDGGAEVRDYALRKQPKVSLEGRHLFVKVEGEVKMATPSGLHPVDRPEVALGPPLRWGSGMRLAQGAELPTLSVLRVVQRIGVRKVAPDAAEIYLVGANVWALTAKHGEEPQLLRRWEAVRAPMHKFERVRGDHPASRLLVRSSLPGGAQAWVDQRGLLHLRGPNAAEGDLTLTLDVAQGLAAWSSRGWRYHRGEAVLGRPELLDQVNRWILNFADGVSDAARGSVGA